MDAAFYFNFLHQVYNFKIGSQLVKTSIEFQKTLKEKFKKITLFQSLCMDGVFNFNFFS